MNLLQLTQLTDKLFYNNSNSYKVIQSKQKELLEIIKPTTDIKKINYKVIQNYIQQLQNKGNKPATINSKTAYLSHILNYAYHNQLINNKPYIPYMKIIKTKEKYITSEEVMCMLAYCEAHNQPELYNIILIGLYTGLRINNILSLTKENYQNGCLYIYDKKTNENFIIPVAEKIKSIIINFNGFKIDYNKCYYLFNLMKKELNLDDQITIHTLRHTFCSNLIQKGVPITTIQKLANHKKITTTMRYAHLSQEQLKNAIDIL